MKKQKKGNPLWTRDFTILTVGSMISMFGNTMSGFAMSLMVLDYTGSSMLYAIYVAVFTLPQIFMPIVSGAILDRFSRRKTIYTLDFISSGLYAVTALLLAGNWFNFPMLAVYCFLLGCINSIYTVAYQSFYPLLISEGNYSKAYSISAVLETLSMVMVPAATWFYHLVGIAPLLGINALCFLAAATIETRIRAREEYIERQQQNASDRGSVRRTLGDIKEGFAYLWQEKGLLSVTVYFTCLSFSNGSSEVILLPYFKGEFQSGEYIYMLVVGMSLLGRMIGGAVLYKLKIPVKWKYALSLLIYTITFTFEGIYLYFPIPVMQVICFINGFASIFSYTIRISATQSYVPDEKKGRYNGAFNMLNRIGGFSGQLLAGALATRFAPRGVYTAFMLFSVLSAIVIIGGGHKEVRKIYNVEQ